MDERNTGSFHLTGAGQSGGVSAQLPREVMESYCAHATEETMKGFASSVLAPLDKPRLMEVLYRMGFECGWRIREGLAERSAEPTRAGTERHTRNEPDPESGISPGSSIPVERGMV